MPQRRSNRDCLFWGRVQSRTQRWPSNQSLSSKSSTKSSGLCRFLAPKSLFCQGKSTRRPIWRDHPDPWLVRIHQRRYSWSSRWWDQVDEQVWGVALLDFVQEPPSCNREHWDRVRVRDPLPHHWKCHSAKLHQVRNTSVSHFMQQYIPLICKWWWSMQGMCDTTLSSGNTLIHRSTW